MKTITLLLLTLISTFVFSNEKPLQFKSLKAFKEHLNTIEPLENVELIPVESLRNLPSHFRFLNKIAVQVSALYRKAGYKAYKRPLLLVLKESESVQVRMSPNGKQLNIIFIGEESLESLKNPSRARAVFAHEIAHIILGHNGLKNNSKNTFTLEDNFSCHQSSFVLEEMMRFSSSLLSGFGRYEEKLHFPLPTPEDASLEARYFEHLIRFKGIPDCHRAARSFVDWIQRAKDFDNVFFKYHYNENEREKVKRDSFKLYNELQSCEKNRGVYKMGIGGLIGDRSLNNEEAIDLVMSLNHISAMDKENFLKEVSLYLDAETTSAGLQAAYHSAFESYKSLSETIKIFTPKNTRAVNKTIEDEADILAVKTMKSAYPNIAIHMGKFLLEDQYQECMDLINRGEEPNYGDPFYIHHATCWRHKRNLSL